MRIFYIIVFFLLATDIFSQSVGITDDASFLPTSLLHVNSSSGFINDIFTCGKDATTFFNITNNGNTWVGQVSPYPTDLFSSTINISGQFAINGYNILNTAASGGGIYGESRSPGTFGILGINTNSSGTGIVGSGNGIVPMVLGSGTGGAFSSSNVGVFGYGNSTPNSWGVWGTSYGEDGVGVVGNVESSGTVNIGVFGTATGATINFGVYTDISTGVSEWTIGALVSGIYNNINIGDAGFIYTSRVSAAGGNSIITGFTGGYNGRILYLYINNSSNDQIEIYHENNGSDANNRIRTNTNNNIISTDDSSGCMAIFIYSGTLSRWVLISFLP